MNKYSFDTSQVQLAVRRDLREHAFRKYEQDIAQACVASVIVDVPLNMKQHTYASRLRDAILAAKRYKYKSDLIPIGFSLDSLKVIETMDGRVMIVNMLKSAPATAILTEWENVQAKDLNRVRELMSGVIAGRIKLTTHRCMVYYSTAAEREGVMALLKDEFPDEADTVRDEGHRLAI